MGIIQSIKSGFNIFNKDLLYTHGTLLSVMWQPEWEGSLGENGYMYIYMAESFHCSPEAITILLMAIPQWKIKSLS